VTGRPVRAVGWDDKHASRSVAIRGLRSRSLIVERDNADTGELRARNASESGRVGLRAACGCVWALAIVKPCGLARAFGLLLYE
jgi:hypothetical protein